MLKFKRSWVKEIHHWNVNTHTRTRKKKIGSETSNNKVNIKESSFHSWSQSRHKWKTQKVAQVYKKRPIGPSSKPEVANETAWVCDAGWVCVCVWLSLSLSLSLWERRRLVYVSVDAVPKCAGVDQSKIVARARPDSRSSLKTNSESAPKTNQNSGSRAQAFCVRSKINLNA